ncbi:hypothetical protein SAMN04488589_1359 [Methanolobus vulcani]|uniref:DUF8180 domain-containing protein n=1 Tax=Methanolobus vulcani TaxID=38026 RepID=A0A7Z7AWC0_9EURY|nr:hypothetical protein [Methanolobus vulcani]SDF79909.1 hypothetical protein SAMN04488589_1359 [Methanolobus vulcani]
MELDKAKLEHLMGHWIEHNDSHSKSFNEWAEKIEAAGYADIAEDVRSAAKKMDECSVLLENARRKLE